MGQEFFNAANTIPVGGYTIFSGSVGLHLKKCDVLLNGDNLLDKQRYIVGSIGGGTQLYPGAPITPPPGCAPEPQLLKLPSRDPLFSKHASLRP